MSKLKKMRNIFLFVLSLVLVAGLAVDGTLAYLQDDDGAVNVMTVGKVRIEQLEYERAVDENGAWVSTGEADKYGYTPDLLQPYENYKPLYPAVFADGKIKWDDRNGSEAASGAGSYQQSWGQIGASGSNQLFDDSVKNVLDHMVFVKNSGDNGAYIRTWFAFEQGSIAAEDYKNVVMTNTNGDHWSWKTVAADVAIDGNTYVVWCATYLGPKSNPNGILVPGAVSYPSLLQLYMKPEATNADVEAIDGNGNGLYDVLVLSQAVQADGFTGAEAALAESFGTAHPWTDNPPVFPGEPAPANEKAEYNGTEYATIYEAVAAANANGGGEIKLLGSAKLNAPLEIASDITFMGNNAMYTRAEGYTGTMITVKAGATLTVEAVTLDGSGATATGNLIATEGSGSIVLNEGTVLQNNNGAHAVSLATRGGGTLTLNSAQIINNSSDSGAIWGGGHIIVNAGSKISNNSSTGSAGAIRMVSSCNLTMNGGEISNNTAAGDGGAIWGYGSSTYNFNGGKISGNESAGTGGAIYTGTYSVINISGDFEMKDNKAANTGAIRLTDHTSLTMTGGTVAGNTQNGASNAFNTWNNSMSLTGGTINDDISYVGGLGLTVGAADIDGVIAYDLSTNHNTAYLAADFNGFKFTVNEAAANFANFNFKPAAGYTYADGDEAKLVCLNDGYSTYWDAATETFRLQAK